MLVRLKKYLNAYTILSTSKHAPVTIPKQIKICGQNREAHNENPPDTDMAPPSTAKKVIPPPAQTEKITYGINLKNAYNMAPKYPIPLNILVNK